MKAIILAGGSGTRLWPLSRKNYPKQFLKLNGDSSLLQQTVERLLIGLSRDDIIVMTNDGYKFFVLSDLKPYSVGMENILLEPVGRNTAPAIALGIKFCMERLGCDYDEVVFISPSDHLIKPVERFAEYITLSEKIAAEGYIVTFGIKPTRPETGYGYIEVRNRKSEVGSRRSEVRSQESNVQGPESIVHGSYYHVEKFVEKPDKKKAEEYLEKGTYYWNSGMFAFQIGTIIDEFKRHAPEISEMLEMPFDKMLEDFHTMPEISVDYAIMEKSDRVVTMPLDIYWNDIGSWDSIYEVLEKDNDGNITKGDVLPVGTKDTLIIGDKRLITTIGLEDCLVVETDDAILIAKKGETQRVKDVVEELKKRSRKEVSEHVTTYRPWGSYTILETGPRYKIKRIVVNPGEKLSLQKHYHRSEHWVVVRGTARVTIGDGEIYIHENESVYVPKSTLHRLENPGKIPVEIIEVQNGEYVEEDDIVRFDDHYGRHQSQ